MNAWLHTAQQQRAIDAIYRKAAQTFGLGPVEAQVMMALYARNAQRPTELAARVGRAATSFTPVLDRLVDEGWVYRSEDPTDRRAVQMRLTEFANEQRSALAQAMREADDRAADTLAHFIDSWLSVVPADALAAS